MIDAERKTIDNIKIEFDKNFIEILSILTKRKIEPIIVNIENKEIIIGFKCPVVMEEVTFEEDKKSIEADVLKIFADLLNSKICNRDNIPKEKKRRISKNISFPCPICGGYNTIGNGNRKTKIGLKKKRLCMDCNKCYTNQENAIWKMKNSRNVIEDALKMSEYLSLRDTAKQIREKYNIEISYSAISYWKKNKRNLLK